MFKKIFNPKRKHQEQGKPKITLDQASQVILSRHFSPLPSRAKSPSDVLDIVGYPLIATATTTTTRRKSVTFKNTVYKPQFSQSSPELSTPAVVEKPYRLTIRNNISPTPPPELDNDQVLLLEASREEKTLVEKELLESKNMEVYRLHQKLLELEQEREMMNQKFQDFIEREEQMRNIIQESQFQINQLRYYAAPSRHNSYKTTSTRSSSWYSDEPEEEERYPYRSKSNHDLYYYYYPQRYYYPYYYY